jgi:hypothetical protein
MPIAGLPVYEKLNGKEILDLWIELGTLDKVAKYLFDHGRTTTGGKIFQYSYLATPVYRWIVHNIDEAWEIYQKEGTPFNRDQFNRWIVRIAMRTTVLGNSTPAFIDWVYSNGFEKYRDIYAQRFPDKPDKRWLEARRDQDISPV